MSKLALLRVALDMPLTGAAVVYDAVKAADVPWE